MILTSIGEIGVHWGERTIVLRPSLYAMSRLGGPKEIVRVFSSVMGDHSDDRLGDALAAIYACTEEDVSDVFGHWSDAGYMPGSVPVIDVLHLARCLLKHGVVGALPEMPGKPGEEPEYVGEFDARAHVSLAIAHLGMSEQDAWRTTMTALVGALRAKFPRPESNEPGAKAPTKEQHQATMDWFERVEAARKQNQGAH